MLQGAITGSRPWRMPAASACALPQTLRPAAPSPSSPSRQVLALAPLPSDGQPACHQAASGDSSCNFTAPCMPALNIKSSWWV